MTSNYMKLKSNIIIFIKTYRTNYKVSVAWD